MIERPWTKRVSSPRIDFRNLTRFRDLQLVYRMLRMPLLMHRMTLVMTLRELTKLENFKILMPMKRRMR